MDWTLDEFYADGGTTRFVDRIAAVLGVHRSRIKTVAVYEGSVIVDFFIEAISDVIGSNENDSPLDVLAETLADAITTGVANLGAAVLGLEGGGKLLAGDPIPAAGGGGGSTASLTNSIFLDDNLWDRYTRI